MLIYCPQCKSGYDVDDALIPEEGRRLHCSSCGAIFRFDRSGASETVTVVEPPADHAEASAEMADSGHLPEEDETLAAEPETPTAEIPPAPEAEPVAESAEDNVTTAEDNAESAVKQESAEDVSESAEAKEATNENKSEAAIAEPTVNQETLHDPTVELTSEVNLNDIFERLNEQSEQLFREEQKLPKKQRLKLWLKTVFGLNRKINFKPVFLVLGLVAVLSLYNYRYEIVRALPFMNGMYRSLGIRARIPGEGLEFQNINWNYIDDDTDNVLEVKGYINNPTSRAIEIPLVHVELLDANSVLLRSINQKPSLEVLKADGRVAVNIAIKTPSPTAKYVYLTFIEDN